ncbi:unnamed protein product, partial [Nippostrongylus brasiliensis]|uniref:Protein kinase domain-containing protein n=1 Tax=Nippostrongylus brasiliensis TaxID=27835 RepID=A0A0N4YZG3_NIPBR
MVLKVAKSNGTAEHRRAVHADVAREAAMLHRLSHANVLALRGVCIQMDPLERPSFEMLVVLLEKVLKVLPSFQPNSDGESTEENSLLAMERLARDVARDEPTLDHTNPFLDHERFRKERKILPRKGNRRRSETKPERGLSDTNYLLGGPNRSSSISVHAGLIRRRCSSLPPEIDSPYMSRDFLDEKSEHCPGGVPLIYRDFDM